MCPTIDCCCPLHHLPPSKMEENKVDMFAIKRELYVMKDTLQESSHHLSSLDLITLGDKAEQYLEWNRLSDKSQHCFCHVPRLASSNLLAKSC